MFLQYHWQKRESCGEDEDKDDPPLVGCRVTVGLMDGELQAQEQREDAKVGGEMTQVEEEKEDQRKTEHRDELDGGGNTNRACSNQSGRDTIDNEQQCSESQEKILPETQTAQQRSNIIGRQNYSITLNDGIGHRETQDKCMRQIDHPHAK